MAELQAELAAGRSLPPVERWTPEYCGQIDLRIARDGAWYYIGTPIARPALVRLFSTILRKEPDGRYCLVTPVEMAEITVEDAPFLAVQAQCKGEGQAADWSFLTNVGDTVTCDAGHCLRVIHNPETGEPRPYIHVRRGLEARVVRPVFYELVEAAIVTRIGDQDMLGIWSGGVFHALGEAPRDDA
ncbi:MAG TPA: DUF1285 domain-containing protein [Alphaproteobacteria bacterium]|nr:DUF1285 domain-containing protein [Alphaproteobacteria bacterium]